VDFAGFELEIYTLESADPGEGFRNSTHFQREGHVLTPLLDKKYRPASSAGL
jgi:hypothetical protein